MKNIHAISTILAGWRIGPFAQAVPSHPARPMVGYVIHRQALSLSSISGLLLICGGTALLYFGTGMDPK